MKNINFKLALFAFLWLCHIFAAHAQRSPAIDSLETKLNLYGIKTHSPKLFLHLDKNVYINNENVWFTGYLFGADYRLYSLLSVTLVKDDDRAVVLENKFILKNGLSFGSTAIPDSISPGNYTFIATTNRLKNGQPEVVFKQPITLKSATQPGYTASLNPVDTSLTGVAQKIMLLVGFTGVDKPPATVPASWYVGNAARPVLRGFIKTKAGQYIFNIPSKLLSKGNNILHVQVQYKSETKEVSMALPAPAQPATVRFYPEGGNLVNTIHSMVGWEVKNAAGAPIKASALLCQGNKIIDTIETNSYGMGRFSLTPQPDNSYFVKLYGVNKIDTLYKLPTAIAQGPVISLTNAVVNDTLAVTLKDNQKEKLYLIGHNYKQLFFATPVAMSSPTKKIKLIIKDIPRGLTQLTVTDSTGKPFAELAFFAHYGQRTPLKIATDKQEYNTRQKVNVKIRLDSSTPIDGLVSVACVQENRLELRKWNDIESYFYLKEDLGELSARDSYLRNTEGDVSFLEDILLIKGWARYKWTDVLRAQPKDIIQKYTELAFRGKVTNLNSTLTSPVDLVNMHNPLNLITTGRTGFFILNNESLLTDSGKKAIFMVKALKPRNYGIHLLDPYTDINELLAGKLNPENYNVPGEESTQYLALGNDSHNIQLKEVKINGGINDNTFYSIAGRDNDVELGSTFLAKNQMRAGGIDGKASYLMETYAYVNVFEPPYILRLNGINSAREFYVPDYSKTPEEPQYLSTLYWKHLVKVSSVSNTELSFYTGDITGKFKIVIQGLAGNSVTYGEAIFNVFKPNKN